jgi:hypothetical protein
LFGGLTPRRVGLSELSANRYGLFARKMYRNNLADPDTTQAR